MTLIALLCALATLAMVAVFGPGTTDRGRAIAFRLLAVLCAVFVLLTAGCDRARKPDVPRGVIIQPKAVPVTRTEYVAVPPEFTDPLPIAEGPLAMCPDVAAARKKALVEANADRKAVRALSGTEKKP